MLFNCYWLALGKKITSYIFHAEFVASLSVKECRDVSQCYLGLADIISHSALVCTWCTWLEIPSLWSEASCNMCIFQSGWFTPSVKKYESGTYCLHRGLRCISCHWEVEGLNQAVNFWHMAFHSLHISCHCSQAKGNENNERWNVINLSNIGNVCQIKFMLFLKICIVLVALWKVFVLLCAC